MGRCADKMAWTKPSLSLKSQTTGIRSTTRLGLHCNGDVTFGGRGPKTSHLKLTKVKKYGILAEITKFNAHQIFPLYNTHSKWEGIVSGNIA